MKNILCILLAGILLCGCNSSEVSNTECYKITGRYCESSNNQNLILSETEGAICISPEDVNEDVFAGLESGDEIEITIDGVEETYPAHTTVYKCTLIQKGTVNDLDTDELQRLMDLGWKFSFEEGEAEATATVQGPYGSISISIPNGWSYEICDVDDEKLLSADYGIQFFPDEASGGYIELGYHSSFGVCGMGLEEEETTLAGDKALIGYFDGSSVWGFVNFSGENAGIVAMAIQNEGWDKAEHDDALEILDSLIYNPKGQSQDN